MSHLRIEVKVQTIQTPALSFYCTMIRLRGVQGIRCLGGQLDKPGYHGDSAHCNYSFGIILSIDYLGFMTWVCNATN